MRHVKNFNEALTPKMAERVNKLHRKRELEKSGYFGGPLDLNKEMSQFELGLNQLNRTIRELEDEIKSNSIDKLECASMIRDANDDLY
jgi:hypothetical protein